MSLFTKTEKPQKKSVDGIKPEARTKSNVFTRATLGISSLLLAGGLVVGCAQSENPKDVKEPQKKELKVVTPSRDNSPFAEKEIGVKAKTVADAQGTVKEEGGKAPEKEQPKVNRGPDPKGEYPSLKDTDVIDEPVEGMAFFINGKRGTCKDGWIKKILVNDNDMVMVYRANTHIELSTFDVSARVDKKGAYNEWSDRKNNILPKEGDRVIIYSKDGDKILAILDFPFPFEVVDTERLPKDTKGWWVPERVIHVPPDNGHLIQLGKEALTKRQGKFKDAKPSFNETEVELNMENPIAMLPNGSQIALTQFISEGRTASKFIGEFTITDLDGRYIHFSAEAGKNEPLGVSDTRDKISDRMIYTVTVPEQDLSGFPDDKLRVKVKCEPRPLDASYTTDPMMNAHGQPEILPGVYRLSR